MHGRRGFVNGHLGFDCLANLTPLAEHIPEIIQQAEDFPGETAGNGDPADRMRSAISAEVGR